MWPLSIDLRLGRLERRCSSTKSEQCLSWDNSKNLKKVLVFDGVIHYMPVWEGDWMKVRETESVDDPISLQNIWFNLALVLGRRSWKSNGLTPNSFSFEVDDVVCEFSTHSEVTENTAVIFYIQTRPNQAYMWLVVVPVLLLHKQIPNYIQKTLLYSLDHENSQTNLQTITGILHRHLVTTVGSPSNE